MYGNQIPRGPDALKCPLWKKPMADVCHTCPWWCEVRGKDPQSTQEVGSWGCAISWWPKLMVENSQRQMQTAASVDKVATEVKTAATQGHETTVSLVGLLNRAIDVPNRLAVAPPTDTLQIEDQS